MCGLVEVSMATPVHMLSMFANIDVCLGILQYHCSGVRAEIKCMFACKHTPTRQPLYA